LTRLIEGRAATSLAGQCELLAARETHRWHHPAKGTNRPWPMRRVIAGSYSAASRTARHPSRIRAATHGSLWRPEALDRTTARRAATGAR